MKHVTRLSGKVFPLSSSRLTPSAPTFSGCFQGASFAVRNRPKIRLTAKL